MRMHVRGAKCAAGFCAAFLLSASSAALAGTTYAEKTLWTFNGTDGNEALYGNVVLDIGGDVYGTTATGGAENSGTVFRVNSDGTEDTLYTFTGGADGSFPSGTLLLDGSGNIYGTASGTVWMLTNNANTYSFSTLATFPNSGYSYAGVIMDKKGNLYGTEVAGGDSGYGAVYEITAKGKYKPLHPFDGAAGGANPYAGVIMDKKGNLYGTTFGGGDHGFGTVYRLAPDGTYNVLYSFKGTDGQTVFDGAQPTGGLVADKNGNMYGTTNTGGTVNDGTAFEITAAGAYQSLWSFGAGTNKHKPPDGGDPKDTPILAGGVLYITTAGGGANGQGAVISLVPGAKSDKELYSFCAPNGGCGGGVTPYAGLAVDGAGNLYGVTAAGGDANYNSGAVFELVKQ